MTTTDNSIDAHVQPKNDHAAFRREANLTTKPRLTLVKSLPPPLEDERVTVSMEQLFTSDGRALIFHDTLSEEGDAETMAAALSILAEQNYFLMKGRLVRVGDRDSGINSGGVMFLTQTSLAKALADEVCTVVIEPPATAIDEIHLYPLLAKWIFAKKPFHEFRRLTKVVSWPARRPDGSCIFEPGYDRRSGYFVYPPEDEDTTGDPELDALIASLG